MIVETGEVKEVNELCFEKKNGFVPVLESSLFFDEVSGFYLIKEKDYLDSLIRF